MAGGPDMSALLERWRSMAGADADGIGAALIAAWNEPQRHCHAQTHLEWLLDEEAPVAGGEGADLQLERNRVFRTDLYEHELGETARANMAWEREELKRGCLVKG